MENFTHLNQLRFMTCGSVDDGKSTLIGQLLLHSDGILEDQFADLEDRNGNLQLNQIVDGLLSEREQGITIDVAHRYFSTAKRKFIILDTPGHEQYTRNMATAASNVDLAMVLVDAEKGIRPQTKRHCFINSLMGVKHLVILVNKMDAVQYSEEVFADIRDELTEYLERLDFFDVRFIPISATQGDNVVNRSANLSWYKGFTVMNYLEDLYTESDLNFIDLRLPIQNVIFHNKRRYYLGKVASGILRNGQKVTVLPGQRQTTITKISIGEQTITQAKAGQSVTVELADEIDISRGSYLVNPDNPIEQTDSFDSKIVWMSEKPLTEGETVLIRQRNNIVKATVSRILYKFDIENTRKIACHSLELNDIGRVQVKLHSPLFVDKYRNNKYTGSFIIIDYTECTTVGAGVVESTKLHDDRKTFTCEFHFVASSVEAELKINALKSLPEPATYINLFEFLGADYHAHLEQCRLLLAVTHPQNCRVHIITLTGLATEIAKLQNPK